MLSNEVFFMNPLDVLVIGAGQAALSIGYYLSQSSLRYLIVGAEQRIGDPWRQRYDSLVLFTPRSYSALPGMPFPGPANEFPNKDETADYLESYARAFQLPIQLNTKLTKLVRRDSLFFAETTQGPISAKQVVIATGPFQKPYIPDYSTLLHPDIRQLHSSSYRNPGDLPQGTVLIVGAGNSGAQIAVELSESRQVMIASGHRLLYLPMKAAGRSIFHWFDRLGILGAGRDSWIGTKLRQRPDPIFGKELKRAIASGRIQLMPRVTAASGNQVIFADGRTSEPAAVLWSTGFTPDYSWVSIPGVLDSSGRPIHEKGISSVEGLYYLGLPWQQRRSSALLGGVGHDAELIYEFILERTVPR
jgi:putative flavoprotein involved in K+ transport